MHEDQDFDLNGALPPNAAELTQDLELNTLFGAMAAGDTFLLAVAKQAVLASLREPEAILYRRHILADCLQQPEVVREMYAIAVEAIEGERKIWGWTEKYPEGLLHRSLDVLKIFSGLLRRLRRTADEHGTKFRSAGFTRLFGMLARELDDEYLEIIGDHLQQLAFRHGLRMSAGLGKSNKGIDYVLLGSRYAPLSWMDRLRRWIEQSLHGDGSGYYYEIADRDEAGFRALGALRERGISHVATALGQSTDHILSFFMMLRLELAFYIGCLNLRDQLAARREPVGLPEPLPAGDAMLSSKGLYDVCLSLTMKDQVVGNDVSADHKTLVMATGANRGGKSTFLRSIGLAQVMMQCGMFVPAESFRANVCASIFTHFKREEDKAMRSGKLDEELGRMSAMVGSMTSNSLVLLNESFASTNEREGSEIARQIVRALLESGIKVFYVTHMFDLAQGFYRAKMDAALFLSAERLADGRRTFRIVEGEPLPTSYGEDLYRRIFGAEIHPAGTEFTATVGESLCQDCHK
jgi:hypothetical protein